MPIHDRHLLDGHVSIETWRKAAEESQRWADEARAEALRRRQRLDFWRGVLIIIVPVAIIAVIVAIYVTTV